MSLNLPEYKAEKFDGNEKLPIIYTVSFIHGHNGDPRVRGQSLQFNSLDYEQALNYYDNQIENSEDGGGDTYLSNYIWFNWNLVAFDPTNNTIKVLRTYSKVRSSKRTVIKPAPKSSTKINLNDFVNITQQTTSLDIGEVLSTISPPQW